MFVSVGKAYIAQAFLQHFGMIDLDGAPTKHMFDGDVTKATDQQLQEYFDHVIGLFVDEFVVPVTWCWILLHYLLKGLIIFSNRNVVSWEACSKECTNKKSCGSNFVYDRVVKECTNENLIEIIVGGGD